MSSFFIESVESMNFSCTDKEKAFNLIAQYTSKVSSNLLGNCKNKEVSSDTQVKLIKLRMIFEGSNYFQSLWRCIVGGTPRMKINPKDLKWVYANLTPEQLKILEINIVQKNTPCGWLPLKIFLELVKKLEKFIFHKVRSKLRYIIKYDMGIGFEDFTNEALYKGIIALRLKEPMEDPLYCFNFAKRSVINFLESKRKHYSYDKRARIVIYKGEGREYITQVIGLERNDGSEIILDRKSMRKTIDEVIKKVALLGSKYEQFAQCILGMNVAFDDYVEIRNRSNSRYSRNNMLYVYAQNWSKLTNEQIKTELIPYLVEDL